VAAEVDAALVEAYARAVLEISLPGGGELTVEPAPDGEIVGNLPVGTTHVHVVTAANPFSRVLSDAENDRRNAELTGVLRDIGTTVTSAQGRSPDGAWAEPSFAIFDADEDLVLGLARRYEQHAVYLWTPEARSIVAADGAVLVRQGWRATTADAD
jgi:hypothetical protein